MPWLISMEVKFLREKKNSHNMEVVHTLREGNPPSIFFTNYVFHFVGTCSRIQILSSFQDIPQKAKAVDHLEKANITYLRTTRIQNA